MLKNRATGTWNGTLKGGSGAMKPANGAEIPFSMGTRFEGKRGSNPEEMIGAALAGCFSMALSVGLEKAGAVPKAIRTSAEVTMEKVDDAPAGTYQDLYSDVLKEGMLDSLMENPLANAVMSFTSL